jgi:hypothetical protein
VRKHHIISVVTILLVAACSPKPILMELPDNHPANPSAAESVFVAPVDPFDDRSYPAVSAETSTPDDSSASGPMKPKGDHMVRPHLMTPEMQLHQEHGQ